MDTAVAEEYIEYYADKYKKLTRNTNLLYPYVNVLIKMKYTMP